MSSLSQCLTEAGGGRGGEGEGGGHALGETYGSPDCKYKGRKEGPALASPAYNPREGNIQFITSGTKSLITSTKNGGAGSPVRW